MSWRELLLPVVILGAIAGLLFPIPLALLDVLLVANLMMSFFLLINAFYISDPIKLSALPSILLLTTLFRLSLNISTTRMILSTGEGGEAVEAFGNVVASGNLVVGAVVFLIITLVQFIVIAKGSERVAEVAARFTLDALPGKQMSIDADMRAGAIDMESARKKRQDLQTESRFYGALDGAMKFIKGDAVAGIVIVLVNVVGGLLIGTLVHGLDITAALRRYTILTIGDGLLSQIPALLSALAAGMVVTRVVRGDNVPLGIELISQLGELPTVRLIVGVLGLALALLPGLPALPFLLVGGALVGASMRRSAIPNDAAISANRFQPRVPALLQIKVGSVIGRSLLSAPQCCSAQIGVVRERIFEKTGMLLRSPELSGLVGGSGLLIELFVRGVLAAHWEGRGQIEVDMPEIIRRLLALVDDRGIELLDDVITRRMLDNFEGESPELVSNVVPTILSVTQLTEILKGLVREHITLRHFDLILQAVAEHGPKGGTERSMLAEVRIALRRVISAMYANEDGRLSVITLEPILDLLFAKVERENMAIDPDVVHAVIREIERLHRPGCIVLVSSKARHLLRDCIELQGLHVPVLAHEELTSELTLAVIGEVAVPIDRERERMVERIAA